VGAGEWESVATSSADNAPQSGTLRLVATPIGNLEDVTLRALAALRGADLLLAEDTRRTRVLLSRFDIAGRPESLHAHNEAARVKRALAVLEAGGSVVLVSDAGTPLVSDPGQRLVEAAVEAGFRVEPLPGPSAVLAALTASGLPAASFAFLGFPPRRRGPRRAWMQAWRGRAETLVLFESPRRLPATLAELAEALGPRRACVARELTKLHEELVRGGLEELAERFREGARGEVTVVVEGDPEARAGAPRAAGPDAETLERRVRELVAEGLSARDVAARVAYETGRPRREVYALAVAARGQR